MIRKRLAAFLLTAGLGLFVVADGMGGYEGGEIASAIAVEAIHDLVRRTAGDADVTWPYQIDPARSITENELMVATRLAADRIAARRHGELRDMGSTVVALRLSRDGAVIAHVGGTSPYPGAITCVLSAPPKCSAYAIFPRKYNALMNANASAIITSPA